MVTHDPRDALRIARQCIVVASGKAMPPQETHYLFQDPPFALKQYLGDRAMITPKS
jgi:thiamine transport system ATP-binding protein